VQDEKQQHISCNGCDSEWLLLGNEPIIKMDE